jgi:hypothetical protein
LMGCPFLRGAFGIRRTCSGYPHASTADFEPLFELKQVQLVTSRTAPTTGRINQDDLPCRSIRRLLHCNCAGGTAEGSGTGRGHRCYKTSNQLRQSAHAPNNGWIDTSG